MIDSERSLMKRFIKFLVLILVLAGVLTAGAVYMTPPPPAKPVFGQPPAIGAAAAVVVDGNTGAVYGDKNGNMKMYPASTTKVLTAIIALEEGKAKLDQNIVVTPRAMAQDGTNLGVRPDMPISLRETLYGMMLVSGNDAAVAVAETVGGSYDRFIEMMNEKAAAIGAVHSHFANPNGLTDPNHYITAEDMAKISVYAMRNPEFRAIVREQKHNMVYRDGMYRIVENRNDFLKSWYLGANGVKTGTTEAAGDCLVASAERNGQLIIVAVYNDKKRFEDVKPWLDYGFQAAQMEKEYEAAMAAEPAFYKWVNQKLGRE